MSYVGSSNFIVEPLDASNQSTGESLANEIGTWKGSAPFGLSVLSGSPTKIKIQAEGEWSIRIAPISTAPQFKIPSAGRGTGVYLYVGDAATWAITHVGEANFIVEQTGADGTQDGLINEIGRYAGTVPVSAGPSIISIQADGTWTFKAG